MIYKYLPMKSQKKISTGMIVIVFVLLANVSLSGQQFLYLDSNQPIDKRVEDLLSRMTLEEKIGQMNMPCVYERGLGRDIESKFEGVRKFADGTKEPGVGPGGGFFTLTNEILHEGPRQQAEFINEIQKIAVEGTRLKIPLLMTEEGTHGLMCPGRQFSPEGLAIGSTWNMELVKEIYHGCAREARATGIHSCSLWLLSLTGIPEDSETGQRDSRRSIHVLPYR